MKRSLIFLMTLGPLAAAATPLTWKQSLQRAAENNAELKAARANFESTQDLAKAARSGFLPTITLNTGLDRTSSTSDGVTTGGDNSYTASVTATQNLFAGFGDTGRVSQANANARASEASLNAVKAKASSDLKTAYEGLIHAKEYIKLTEEILRRRADNLRMVELRFSNGRENKGSVLLSKAYLSQAKLDDLQARNDLETTRAQLARVLGYDDPSDVDASEPVPLSPPPAAPDFKKLATGTPDHLQAEAQDDAARAGVTVARAGFFPSLNLTGSVGKWGADYLPRDDRWSMGLTLSLPLFNGGRDAYTVRSAAAVSLAASLGKANVDRDLLAKLKQAYANFTEAVAKFEVDQNFRDAAVVRAEIARSKYNNGLLTFEDWDVIENDLINRQKAFVVSKQNRVLAEAAWELAQGTGVLP